MKPSTASYIKSVTCEYPIPEDLAENISSDQYHDLTSCEHEYAIDPNLTITTTLKDGLVFVSYLRYATDDNGSTLIPDNENLKDAIFHFCMYRYWLSKSSIKEEGSRDERNFHLRRYSFLMKKAAAEINQPSLGQMENMKNMRLRMHPSTDKFDSLFIGMNAKTSSDF